MFGPAFAPSFAPKRLVATAIVPLLVLAALAFPSRVRGQAPCSPPAGGGVAICSPSNSSKDVNPVHFIAAASSPTCTAGISLMSIWSAASGAQLYSVGGSQIDTFLPLRPGAYNTLVKASDKCGGSHQTAVAITVTGTAVITYQYNVERNGANLFETQLTTANVNSGTFGKIFSCPIDASAYGQPLFVPNLSIAGATHNAVFVATEKNSVYAFDADGKSCTPLWHTSIGTAVPCSANLPVPRSNCNSVFGTSTIGITSTMFIDPTQGVHGVIYVEGRTAPGGVAPFFHELHKLDLTTGKDMPDSPIRLAATIAGNGCDSVNGIVTFNPAAQNNRSALLYANGVLYTAFASINDVPVCPNGAYHGWILGYNAFNIQQQVSVFNTSANKSGNGSGAGGFAGIWGGALAASLNNDIYAVTGNGPFNSAVGDWGNSYLRLTRSAKTLKVLDYFAPYQVFLNNNMDPDLGTNTGIILVVPGPTPHELIGGSKDGTVYVVNRDKMGKFNTGSDLIIQELPHVVGVHLSTSPTCGNTASDCDYSSPAYWNGHIYISGVNDHVKDFKLSNGTLTGPASTTPEVFGFPGANATVSANGTKNGIVWLVDPIAAALRAYDATNLANELYNSKQNSTRDALGSHVKFAPPTVVNGRVYVGTKTAIVGYGLLP